MNVRISGNSYTGNWQRQTATLSKTGASSFTAKMKELADTVAISNTEGDPTLKATYDQLSTDSKGVLDRMKAGQTDISQDEWTSLCQELKEAGIITESDFKCTRADLRMVPIGYMDDNGNAVLYDNSPFLSNELLGRDACLSGYSGLSKIWTVSDWSGDPLKYFDQWIESLRKWRSDLHSQRNEDGTQKYDLSCINNNINSCQKVTNLVKALMELS